jgi:hypothetical protein
MTTGSGDEVGDLADRIARAIAGRAALQGGRLVVNPPGISDDTSR